MHLHRVQIGGFAIKNNVWLAPLAGYTNYPFRKIALESGAGFAFTEMVSAKGLCYGSENTKELLYTAENERGAAGVQIFGSDPAFMRRAAESEELAPFEIVDINMGCPVPKIFTNGEGSALLENPSLAEKIVAETAKSGKIVTVKCRIGVNRRKIVAEEFCKRMEGAGAQAITVHGRTRDEMYSGDEKRRESARDCKRRDFFRTGRGNDDGKNGRGRRGNRARRVVRSADFLRFFRRKKKAAIPNSEAADGRNGKIIRRAVRHGIYAENVRVLSAREARRGGI